MTRKRIDGRVPGFEIDVVETDLRDQVFSALRNMGYRESEARLGIERAAARVGASADVATLLKQALSALTENIGKAPRMR